MPAAPSPSHQSLSPAPLTCCYADRHSSIIVTLPLSSTSQHPLSVPPRFPYFFIPFLFTSHPLFSIPSFSPNSVIFSSFPSISKFRRSRHFPLFLQSVDFQSVNFQSIIILPTLRFFNSVSSIPFDYPFDFLQFPSPFPFASCELSVTPHRFRLSPAPALPFPVPSLHSAVQRMSESPSAIRTTARPTSDRRSTGPCRRPCAGRRRTGRGDESDRAAETTGIGAWECHPSAWGQ